MTLDFFLPLAHLLCGEVGPAAIAQPGGGCQIGVQGGGQVDASAFPWAKERVEIEHLQEFTIIYHMMNFMEFTIVFRQK